MTDSHSAAAPASIPAACDLLIDHALVLTLDAAGTTVADGAVAIAGRRIAEVGPSAGLAARWAPARRIDARGRAVLPGMVNVHNHTPLQITRGMVEDLGFAPAYTRGIPQGHALGEEEAYLLARLGAWELLRCGSTTVVDFYRHPEALARAAADLGLRAVIAGRVMDVDTAALADGRYEHRSELGRATLDENLRLVERWQGAADGRIRCDIAPHAPDTCSPALLKEVAAAAASVGGNVHTHLAQSPAEVAWVRERDGCAPDEAMAEAGLLDGRLIAAHVVFLDDAAVARIGAAGITVAHSPFGNAKTGKIAPIRRLRDAGANIALCTDTFSGDMFEATRWAIASARLLEPGLFPKAPEVLRWATANGAAALGMGGEIGAVEAGRLADLVVMDLREPVFGPLIDGLGGIVHTGSGLAVETAIVDGRVVMEDGRPAGGDGAEIVRAARAVAAKLWAASGWAPVGA